MTSAFIPYSAPKNPWTKDEDSEQQGNFLISTRNGSWYFIRAPKKFPTHFLLNMRAIASLDTGAIIKRKPEVDVTELNYVLEQHKLSQVPQAELLRVWDDISHNALVMANAENMHVVDCRGFSTADLNAMRAAYFNLSLEPDADDARIEEIIETIVALDREKAMLVDQRRRRLLDGRFKLTVQKRRALLDWPALRNQFICMGHEQTCAACGSVVDLFLVDDYLAGVLISTPDVFYDRCTNDECEHSVGETSHPSQSPPRPSWVVVKTEADA